jgi:hypothetical protein
MINDDTYVTYYVLNGLSFILILLLPFHPKKKKRKRKGYRMNEIQSLYYYRLQTLRKKWPSSTVYCTEHCVECRINDCIFRDWNVGGREWTVMRVKSLEKLWGEDQAWCRHYTFEREPVWGGGGWREESYVPAPFPPEPVFLNVYGAQESILGIDFASLGSLAGRYDK